jgi:arylsulfatase A-like enzyme
VLAAHDYRTLYVDSSKIDWRPGKRHRKVIRGLGFEQLPGPRKLLDLCLAFDSMLAEFLSSLDAAGLSEELLLVVTGDHGLRYENESASLDEQLGDPEAGYHVPFLLYAPGLIDQPTFVTQNTSHVDVTPTLLDLVGVRVDRLLHHGSSVLDSRVADRVVFLMSNTLSPNDRFLWRDYLFTANSFTGQAYVTRGTDGSRSRPLEQALAEFDEIPETLHDPRRVVGLANGMFDETAAVFLYRARLAGKGH